MAKQKTTVYLDQDVARAARVLAARTGQRDYQIVNDALRRYLGLAAVDSVWARSTLSEAQATALAYSELSHMRREHRQQSGDPSSPE